MSRVLFAATLIAASSLVLLALVSLWQQEIQFWPPPNCKSWQYRTFWMLFRFMFMGIVLLSFLEFHAAAEQDFWWRYYLGGALTAIGFLAAFLATFDLGWNKAHGEKGGLKTDGWYRWSRNPVYVVTIIGIVGLGLVVSSRLLWLVLILWILLYLIVPFLEERWLINQYGEAYLEYKKKVPRFIGLPKK